jgi:hypothetical protein
MLVRFLNHIEAWVKLTIIIVVANDYLLKFAVFTHLTPEVFVESIKVILQL